MKDTIKDEVYDSYQSHWCHQSYHSDCSTCHSENRLLRAKVTVLREDVNITNNYTLHPLGGGSGWDRNPLE
jgi:hypothetical protein